MTSVLALCAAAVLPVASACTFRASRVASAALFLTTLGCAYWLGSLILGAVPWDGARWLVAWLTGVMGSFELRLDGRPRQLGALLVGSSLADLVSLYREAHGAEFGALPVLQIVALGMMIWASRKATEQRP